MKKAVLYSLSVIVILFVLEQVLVLPYILKTAIKLPLFILGPFMFGYRGRYKVGDKKLAAVAALFVFMVIIIAYLFLGFLLDVDSIQSDYEKKLPILWYTVLLASLYTTFVNSFIEEYFFRGFIFTSIKSKRMAYGISALLFAVYHLTIIGTWFSIPLMILMLIGLTVGGVIFAYFADRSDSFLTSWWVHMAADLAIVLVGSQVLFA